MPFSSVSRLEFLCIYSELPLLWRPVCVRLMCSSGLLSCTISVGRGTQAPGDLGAATLRQDRGAHRKHEEVHVVCRHEEASSGILMNMRHEPRRLCMAEPREVDV